MKLNNLKDLLVEQLQDLYDAENQVIDALPKMAEAASSEELKRGFEHHLEQTYQQRERLEEAFKHLGLPAKGKKCVGMQGLIEEGKKVMEEDMEPEVRDAALIAAAQKVEHYEIASYGTARAYAKLLKDGNLDMLLLLTLDEEGQTNEKLTTMAMSDINLGAR